MALAGSLPAKDTATLNVKISGMENETATYVWVSVFSKDDFLDTPLQK